MALPTWTPISVITNRSARYRLLWPHLGAWMGEAIFGGLRAALRDRRRAPVTPVYVSVPPAANVLLLRPFELAHLDESGATLAAQASA